MSPVFSPFTDRSDAAYCVIVADYHFFVSNVARDAYFVKNPEQLKVGVYCVSGGQLQRYVNNRWVVYTAVVQGKHGQSAYELAVQQGFIGTLDQWLATFGIGDTGPAPYIVAGSVITLPPESNASVEVEPVPDTEGAYRVNFEIPRGEKGLPAPSVKILGEYETISDLIAAHPTGNPGDSYFTANGDMYFWDVDQNEWVNVGNLEGPCGAPASMEITVDFLTHDEAPFFETTGEAPDYQLKIGIPLPSPSLPPVLQTGNVSTLPPGSSASFAVRETASGVYALDLSLPKGDKGAPGDTVGSVTSVSFEKIGEGLHVAGDPITDQGTYKISLNDDVKAIEALSGKGYAYRVGENEWELREISIPTPTVSWSTLDGKPPDFPPAAHRHVWGELDNVPDVFMPGGHKHVGTDIVGLGTLATVDDAPANGSILARQDNKWVPVPSSSNSGNGSGGSDRFPIYANVSIYVSQASGDNASGNHLGSPFKTIQAAVDYVYGYLDFKKSGLTVYINVGPGVYSYLLVSLPLPAFLHIRNIDTPNDNGQTRISGGWFRRCHVLLENLTLINESYQGIDVLSVGYFAFVSLHNVAFYITRYVERVVVVYFSSRLSASKTTLDFSTVGNVVNEFVVLSTSQSAIEFDTVSINVSNTINMASQYGAFFGAQSYSSLTLWRVTRTGNKCDKGSYRADCRSVIGSYQGSNDWGTGTNRKFNNGIIETWE